MQKTKCAQGSIFSWKNWYNIQGKVRLAIFKYIFYSCMKIVCMPGYIPKHPLDLSNMFLHSSMVWYILQFSRCQIIYENKEWKTKFNSIYLYDIHIFIVYLIYVLVRRESSTSWSSDIQRRECLKQIVCCCVCVFPMPQRIAQGKHTFATV